MLIATLAGAMLSASFLADHAASCWNRLLLGQHSRETIGRIGAMLQEAKAALDLANGNSHGFCSPEQLTLLRRHFMQSQFLKGIGRRRNGLLYCSTGLGVLNPPRLVSQTPLVTGVRFNIHWPFVMAFANKYPALLVETGEAGTVIDATMLYPPMPVGLSQIVTIAGRVVEMPVLNEADSKSEGQMTTAVPTETTAWMCTEDLPICVTTSMTSDVARSIRYDATVVTAVSGAIGGLGLGLVVVSHWRRRTSMTARLRRAIRRNDLNVVYQPICELSNSRIVGAEALVRWPSGNAAPDEFIRIAEREGFVAEITETVLLTVLKEMASVFAERAGFRVSINVSAGELISGSIFRLLDHCWPEKLPRDHIGFELTERSTAGIELLAPAILRLRQAGHCVYIDDFGTGYSSLAQMSAITIDFVKLDRSFLNARQDERHKAPILPEVIGIARRLGVGLVIEGIETDADLTYVKGLGGDLLGQGWLFAVPMPEHELRASLALDPALPG